MKNAIETAATLLRERAKRTTDATAFSVKASKDKDEILLTPDMKRRTWDWHLNASSFHHMEEVTAICTALHLSFYFSGAMLESPSGKSVPSFEVRIYSL